MKTQWLYILGFSAAITAAAVGVAREFAAHARDATPHTNREVASPAPDEPQSQTLFLLRYGKKNDQIYLHYKEVGCDYSYSTPRTFRVMPNGHIAILANRMTAGALQLFDLQGRLVKYVPYEENVGSGPLYDLTLVDIGGDGKVYRVRRFLYDEFQSWRFGDVVVYDENGEPTKKEEPEQLPNVLWVLDRQGKEDKTLRDKLQNDLYEMLKRHEVNFFGDQFVVTDDDELYIALSSPARSDGLHRLQVMRLHPTEAPSLREGIEVIESDSSRKNFDIDVICRLPNGKLAHFIWLGGDDYMRPRRLEVIGADGRRIAEFTIPESLYQRGLLPRLGNSEDKPVLVRSDRLAMLFFEERRPLDDEETPKDRAQFRLEGLDEEFTFRRYYLVVLDPSGRIVFEDRLYGGYIARLMDADRDGNLYYLNFTPKGVEVKRVSFGE
jgi:hypothetical protein